MISHSGSRLAVIVVLLVLQSLIFIFELLVFMKRVRRTSWYRPFRQYVGPLVIASLAAVLVPATFANASDRVDSGAEECSSSVDGDIAGQGAMIAVWVQVGVLLVISMLGSFHTSATGAKEVGAGLVLTHASLSIALLTQMRLGTLKPAEAIIGSMILDAQNAGLSIQLAAKETLAARWQVTIVVCAQIFGLITIPVLVWNYAYGKFPINGCRCITIFWWAWLSSCGSPTAREMSIFWTYYSCRCVGILQTCFHSLYNTSKFDEAEKSERPVAGSWMERPDMDTLGEEQQLDADLLSGREEQGYGGNSSHQDQDRNDTQRMRDNKGKYANRNIRLRRVTHLYRRQNGQVVCYSEYPATVTLMYTVYGAFSLTSMATVQTSVANFNLKSPSAVDSVGQIVSLIVAAATIGRAIWLFVMLFSNEAVNGDWHFVWPFKWRVNRDRLRGLLVNDYVFCSPPNKDPDILSLGALLTEPFDQNSQIGAVLYAPDGVKSLVHRDVTQEISTGKTTRTVLSLENLGIGATVGIEHSLQAYEEKSVADELRTTSLELGPPLSELNMVAGHQDPSFLKSGKQTLYMVTGIQVAKGVTISVANSRPGTDDLFHSESEVLLAYRLHVVRRSRRKGPFLLRGLYRPEEDW